MLIRLIDVVLIILFGFISISHIDRQVNVEMPKVNHFPRELPDFENWLVVGVHSEGHYTGDYGNLKFTEPSQLNDYIFNEVSENRNLKIRIRADRDIPVAMLRPVIDYCTEQRLPVALDMVLIKDVP